MLKMIETQLKGNQMEEAWVLIYFQDQVVLGRYKNNQFLIPSTELMKNKCLEIHLFNQQKEIRSGKDFKFVVIEDPKKDEERNIEFYFKESIFMIGTEQRKELENGMTILSQNGREMIVPFTSPNKLKLVVHHLFDPSTGYMNGYRLVDIEGGE